jgi:hypothetical protein
LSELLDGAAVIVVTAVEIRKGAEVDTVRCAGKKHGLVDDIDFKPNIDAGVEVFDVWAAHAHAAVGGILLDRGGIQGAMKAEAAVAEAEPACAQWVVGAWFDFCFDGVAAFAHFLLDGFRNVPGGVDFFVEDARDTDWGP